MAVTPGDNGGLNRNCLAVRRAYPKIGREYHRGGSDFRKLRAFLRHWRRDRSGTMFLRYRFSYNSDCLLWTGYVCRCVDKGATAEHALGMGFLAVLGFA